MSFEQKDLIRCALDDSEGFDFVSFSDVPSYFSGSEEQNYLQRLKKGLKFGAHVVIRCYLRIPEGTDLTGYEDVTHQYQDLIDAEQTQVYRIFVYRYKGGI
ncbi:MAG: hypothetical protein HRU09_11555 [Oligoflexales bacterium]|nr:hypothetical protein [Oligoflexales bacterium]